MQSILLFSKLIFHFSMFVMENYQKISKVKKRRNEVRVVMGEEVVANEGFKLRVHLSSNTTLYLFCFIVPSSFILFVNNFHHKLILG